LVTTPDRQGGYFDTELVSDTWPKGDVEVIRSFAPPDELADLIGVPAFIIYRLRRQP
jgi:hypothetical protein